MGCDIHGIIEHKLNDKTNWWVWSDKFHLPRDYNLFGYLAGVRRDGPPVVSPRGIPKDMSTSSEEYWLMISDSGNENTVTPEEAEKYVRGGSRYRQDRSGNNRWVSDPDAHTASWLSADELETAMSCCQHLIDTEFKAILAAMRALESDGREVRFVFWFDS